MKQTKKQYKEVTLAGMIGQIVMGTVIILLLMLPVILYSPKAHAVLCTVINTEGKVAFMFKGDKPTRTLTGTVTKLLPCQNVGTIETRIEVVTEYKSPNPQNECERTAVHVCDPNFQGMKLFTNPNIDSKGIIENNCIGLTIKSGTPPDSTGLYYAYPSMYSGMRIREDGSSYCVFD